jgi:hypothetical protein
MILKGKIFRKFKWETIINILSLHEIIMGQGRLCSVVQGVTEGELHDSGQVSGSWEG